MTVMTLDQRNEMLQMMSDISKEAYGFRVRKDYTNASDDEIQKDWDHFNETAERRWAEEALAETQAWDNFLAELNVIVANGAGTIAVALRWDIDAYEVDGDIGFYCYKRGIAFSKEAEITAMLEA